MPAKNFTDEEEEEIEFVEQFLVHEKHELEYPEGGREGWSTVVGGFIGLLVAYGVMNTMGAIESYVTEHILVDENAVSISMIFSVYSFIMLLFMMVGGVIFDVYGYKQLFVVGGILTCGGMIATGSCTQLYQFFLAFSICTGLGCALLSTPVMTASGQFFNKKRGLACAFVMPGASVGGVIWPLVCRSLYDKVGFEWTMRILGFIFIGVITLSYYLMNDRHEEIQSLKLLNDEEDGITRPSPKTLKGFAQTLKSMVDIEVFKDVTFLWVSIAICFVEFSLLIVTTYIPSYALSKGFNESQSLIALTVTNAAGVLGRLVPTILTDVYGPFNMGTLMSIIMTFAVFVIWLPFGKYYPGLLVFCVIFGFAMAGALAMIPLCTSAISKPRDYGKRFGTVYFFVSFVSLISLPIGMVLTQTKLKYDSMVIFSGCTAFVSSVSFIVCRFRVGGGWKLKQKV